MENYATASVCLPVNADTKNITQARKIVNFGLAIAIASDIGIPVMSINNNTIMDGASSRVAVGDGLVTQPIAPVLTTCGQGIFTIHGKAKVWFCCYCHDGGMAVYDQGDCCPSCGHQKCGYCTEERTRTR